ncbi:2-oxoglutarate dehydrogenase E1 component [Phycisphaerales bacterium AB-hyl4]|uniref:oxoglutarate dehydrogenase (succinyl-transferring) n=1 Tax=Natronomicrosphaera hydrolytica TaxID=3242702 RepID=A0ABV4U518_9BACT
MDQTDLPWPDSTNLAYVEQLYGRYVQDPDSLDPTWREYFDRWAREDVPTRSNGLGPSFQARSIFNPASQATNGNGSGSGNGQHHHGNGHPAVSPSAITSQPALNRELERQAMSLSSLQDRVDQLIRNYRVRGHIVAQLDPLGTKREDPSELDPGTYGFTDADMDRPFHTATMPGPNIRTLRQIIEQLRNTYCRNIGAQFMHIDNLGVRQWLQDRMEADENKVDLSRKEQIRILTRLTDAVIFEQFIQKKFTGAKSFSLEGAESLIPLLDLSLEKAGDQGVREVVIGMAHRGRLNVLANIIGKGPQQIFREFEDVDPDRYIGRGDVKYHLGYSGDWRTRHGQNIHLSLCFNPSHLEFVNPVALGRMRAKQDRTGEATRGEKGMVVLIHGDAAFAGEGIIQETLNLSNLPGYTIGGTLHIVVNNQIGFTTSPPEARSSRYATDVAKMLQIPIFHVNGESPEAVASVVRLAMDFRREFKRDVVIDMYCYRRRGHNEGDEPGFTQPIMYDAIEKRKSVHEGYLDHLLQLGGVTQEDADRIAHRRTELLEKELSAARSENYVSQAQELGGIWENYFGGLESSVADVNTGYDKAELQSLLEKQTRLPDDFNFHPKIKRLHRIRRQMAEGARSLDWASAEALAMATLSVEGYRVRLSGQDCQRGTFSHRHAVVHDIKTGETYCPLQHLAEGQAPIEIVNSPLSEAGVMGFEFGYSLDYPDGLVMWEAQFGDFVNAAQVIIDQFLVSAEDKWRRLNALVLLLPHGFEGQGPEHSSARLERFLMLSAEDNIQVCNPTTPAQYFHLLRRQVLRPWRKPLIVMSPKSLLRHPAAVSSIDAMASGRFHRVLADVSTEPRKDVSRVLLCSGKIYYELAEQREKLERNDVAILRLEQYYPFPDKALAKAIEPYGKQVPVYWVQEEPVNMGAWPMLRRDHCTRLLGRWPFEGIGRPESASPATGSRAAHQIEQERVIAEAFGEDVGQSVS